MTLNYSLLALVASLESYSKYRMRVTAMAVAEKASATLLPGETFIATVTRSTNTGLDRTIRRLRALTDLIGDHRVFSRLWSILGLWQLATRQFLYRSHHHESSLSSSSPSSAHDTMSRQILYAQILVGVVYQWLENTAYLAQHGIVDWSADRQRRAWLWSSRFWAVHVALDLFRLWRVRGRVPKEIVSGSDGRGGRASVVDQTSPTDVVIHQKEKDEGGDEDISATAHGNIRSTTQDVGTSTTTTTTHTADDDDNDDDNNQRKSKQQALDGPKGDKDDDWWRQVFVNALSVPITLHWSLQGGMMNDVWLGSLGSVAAFITLNHSWRNTLDF